MLKPSCCLLLGVELVLLEKRRIACVRSGSMVRTRDPRIRSVNLSQLTQAKEEKENKNAAKKRFSVRITQDLLANMEEEAATWVESRRLLASCSRVSGSRESREAEELVVRRPMDEFPT